MRDSDEFWRAVARGDRDHWGGFERWMLVSAGVLLVAIVLAATI